MLEVKNCSTRECFRTADEEGFVAAALCCWCGCEVAPIDHCRTCGYFFCFDCDGEDDGQKFTCQECKEDQEFS